MIPRIATALILICSLSAAPAFAHGVSARTGYVSAFNEVISRLVQADNAMYEQMRAIARKLEGYYQRNGHLPHPGPQQDRFKANIEKELMQNPYRPQTSELYYGMKLQDDGRVKMYFLNDVFLSVDKVREWRKEAPQGWSADPGTIMVMVNGEGTYAIWAASADRLPLRDYIRNNRTRIIVHDLVEELARQSQ
jgi:hypothetical protein